GQAGCGRRTSCSPGTAPAAPPSVKNPKSSRKPRLGGLRHVAPVDAGAGEVSCSGQARFGKPANVLGGPGGASLAFNQGARVVLVIVLSGVVSAAAALPSPGEFQCYELKSAAFDPVPITVQDRFGTLTYPVRFPHRLCAPTGADPGQIPYLMGYTVDASGARISGLSVVTRFGRSTVDLVRPDRLLVPTAIDRQRTPLAPPGGSPLQCYRVDPSSDSPKFEPIRGVEVVDGLETVTVDVLAPSLLCLPANVNG